MILQRFAMRSLLLRRRCLELRSGLDSTQQGWIGTTRYYRGHIVEALRNHADGAMELGELGPQVRDDYTPTEHGDWLRGLLGGLERDGLVVVDGDGVGLPE